MEVSNEIKEDIRKTQSELKNAIRVHQIWVARLQDDENNIHLKSKVREAEKEIISIGQSQKRVVDRLRRELELYQQRLKSRNKQINLENDARYVAQQIRDHQIQFRNKNRSVSLLKPSVLNEIQIKAESNGGLKPKEDLSDSDNEIKSSNEKENTGSNNSENEDKDRFQKNYQQINVHDSRNNFANALNKVKESLISGKLQESSWQESQRSDLDSRSPQNIDLSPSPSPPPLPVPGEHVSQETFLRLIGLVTHTHKELLEKKRNESRKRSTTSTNKTDFLYGNFDGPKRKKNQFPYLQSHNDPPQTRSAKLKKQQKKSEKWSREDSPSGSSSESKEPKRSPQRLCHGCGRNDAPSLLVECGCGWWGHAGCGARGGGGCGGCGADLPDPDTTAVNHHTLYTDKLAERKRLQEKNIQLCVELRKLEARASLLKENLDDHQAEKRQLLADQIKTQRNLQKLLDFISQFKETSISLQSTSISETGSDTSKSNEE